MSIPCKFERSILSYDEHEMIIVTLVLFVVGSLHFRSTERVFADIV